MSNQALIRKPFEDNDMMARDLNEAMKIGEIVAKSRMFPEVTDQAKAVVAILAGRELGIPPMASLRNIHVVKGKVEIGASLLAAMIRQSGKYNYKVVKSEDDECVLLWSENIGGAWTVHGQSKFTMADAKRAKLIKPDSNWEKFPRAMLFARAMTEGQKKYCPDIGIGAVYAPGEISESDVIDITPEPQTATDIPTAEEIFETPRPLPDTPLPEAWTDDSAARQVADLEIANKINAGLKTIASEIAAEAPKDVPTIADLKQGIQNNLDAHTQESAKPEPDPVPALKPTLTAAQQKVIDGITSACKEHGKDKAEVWELVYKYIGRKIRRSAELTDEEAEKVFTYLQTLASEWSTQAKPEPAPVKYDRKNPAHNAELAKAIEEAIKKLTILGQPFGPLSDLIAELVEREFGRKIAHRYELTDEEAIALIEFLQNRILEKECEKAVKADEV